MTINVKVYDNGDHTCLVWLPTDLKAIPTCRGFTVRRLLGGNESFLHGFVGFSDGDKLDPAAPWKHPLQRYMWWDYGVKPGDVVQYSVVPVIGPDKGHLQLAPDDASALTQPMTISGQATLNISAYFNKGIVAAQWVSRALAAAGKDSKLPDLIKTPGNALRDALSGLLRPQILSMLADVKRDNGEIYAALYELNDPELIAAMKALGQKCHLLLANGAFRPPTNDENHAVREQLRGTVDLHDRIVSSGHFAHNKFVVFCDSSGTPRSVLSGSTNWTVTGLCTQANNGIIVNDPNLAADFLDEWKLLKSAGGSYPPTLAATNSTAKTFEVDGGRITQWFAPTDKDKSPDLAYARKLIEGAKDAILFLFFNPGKFVEDDQPTKWTLLQNILVRHHSDSPDFDGQLYLRGVVNQEIANLTTEPATASTKQASLDPTTPAPVTLFSGGTQPPQRVRYDAMIPKAIKDTFHDFMKEDLGSGVHIHSKVVVIDPFGDHPVVMTGSHNLGYKASSANDDNLMIIEGNAPLAAAYAINIIAIYQTYRWNTYVEAHRQDPQVWHGLVDNDKWQNDYLTGDHLHETQFWLGSHLSTAGPPAPGGTPARTASATGPAPTPPADAPRRPPAGRKTAAKKGAVKKAPTKKAPTKKTPTKKTPAKKAPAKKASAKKAPAKKSQSQRTAVKKAVPAKKRAPVKKAPIKKRTPTKKRAFRHKT